MKTKLLKKIRKKYRIDEINNNYYLERHNGLSWIHQYKTNDKEEACDIIRELIKIELDIFYRKN